MKYLSALLFCLLVAVTDNLSAQHTKFITSGTIEYEKNANMFAIVKKKVTKNSLNMKPHYDEYLREQPQFIMCYSTLTFDNNTTLFVPTKGESIYWTYDSPMANQHYIFRPKQEKKHHSKGLF